MEKRNLGSTFSRVIDNLKDNIKIIFLGGVFVALLFAAYNIVMNGMIKYKYVMAYQATINSEPHFEQNMDSENFSKENCKKIIFTQDFYNVIVEQLPDIGTIDDYVKSISIEYEDYYIKLAYCSEDISFSKEAVNAIFIELEKGLIANGEVSYLELLDNITAERVKRKKESEQKFGITQSIEIGMIIGMFVSAVCVTIGYLGKKNIIDENDVYKYFNLPVLAYIPPIDAKGEENE